MSLTNLEQREVYPLIEFAEKHINLRISPIEDDWFIFSDDIDINIWLDENGKQRATAYEVINGNTITNNYIILI